MGSLICQNISCNVLGWFRRHACMGAADASWNSKQGAGVLTGRAGHVGLFEGCWWTPAQPLYTAGQREKAKVLSDERARALGMLTPAFGVPTALPAIRTRPWPQDVAASATKRQRLGQPGAAITSLTDPWHYVGY